MKKKYDVFFLVVVLLAISIPAVARIHLPMLVRDSMILQRDIPIHIWGWADAGEKIKIRFFNKEYKTRTGSDGQWSLTLSPLKAGGPYSMEISGTNTIILKEILIGDVWICSGQSNMVHQMNIHDVRYEKDIATANYPQIRQFWIPTLTDLNGPQNDIPAGSAAVSGWKAAVGEDVRPFSAVAYFFARLLYEKYHVPIGLINASVGGTPIEAWISEEGLKTFPALQATLQKNKDTAHINGINRRVSAANAGRIPPLVKDKGLTGPKKWYDVTYVPPSGTWKNIAVPGYWEDQGIKDLNGVVWYRKEIEVPVSMNGKAARVFLGRIVDADILYINGQQVGATTYMYPQRRYKIPAGLLKAGKNILVVKVTNNAGKGGFVPDKPYCLFAGADTIDLKGYWQYKVGEVFEPITGGFTGSINAQNQPAALYNAMIAPLINYRVNGFLWYQGESNTNRAEEYTKLQPAQIIDWRNKWKQGDLPFFYVQLPGYMDMNYLPSESQWAALREAQLKSLSVPNTGMAIAIDLGEWNDIHPDNKKDVGERLALLAQKMAYGEKNVVGSGPLFQSARIDGNKIRIQFSNTGSGLVTNDGEELNQFAIAGADKKFVWARASIEGNEVVVWNEKLSHPLYVRYAWADNPDGANLYNKEGLPASPFRTDQ